MTYKLYYDTLPGNKLLLQELGYNIKNYVNGFWRKTSTIPNMMTALGINYKWTNDINDPDAIPIIEIDSQPPDIIHQILNIASKKFKKSIVVSATEQPLPETVALIPSFKKLYPNVLLSFGGNPALNFKSSNVFFYPYYLLKPFTFDITMRVYNDVDCHGMYDSKKYIFNHLSKAWTGNKYLTHYTIKNYFNNEQHIAKHQNSGALLTYRTMDKIDVKERRENSYALIERLKSNMEYMGDIEPSGMYKKLYPAEHYVNCADVDHPDCYPSEELPEDPIHNLDNVGMLTLAHPPKIYEDTHISLITEIEELHWDSEYFAKNLGFSKENPNPMALEQKCIDFEEKIVNPEISTDVLKEKNFLSPTTVINYFISEKTVQPILNKHIFIVGNSNIAACNYNTAFIRDYLGFEIFEEIFDYQKIENGSNWLTTYRTIEQLNEFKEEMIFDNAKVLAEKLHYNRDLIANPNSELRQKLKKWFTEDLLNKFLELNP